VLTVFALRAALAEKVCAAGAANVATVPNVSASDATISTAPIEVAVVDESTDTDLVALAAPECADTESDWLLAAVG